MTLDSEAWSEPCVSLTLQKVTTWDLPREQRSLRLEKVQGFLVAVCDKLRDVARLGGVIDDMSYHIVRS